MQSTFSHLSRQLWKARSVSFFAALAVCVTGCGVTLSPVKRAPVQIFLLETSLPTNSQALLVRFEETLTGTPLTETVWDNVSGAFADARESKQIGFTQDYSQLIPAQIIAGVPGAVAVGTRPDYTRIIIPFGRIFEGVFQSGLQKAFPNSITCSNQSDEFKAPAAEETNRMVSLKVAEFKVWEKPLNHLNLKAQVECKVYRMGVTNRPEFIFQVCNQATNQSIGSVLSTSSGFIKGMNKISNRFAAALSEDVLRQLQAIVGN
jgi:hypothetical protein